MKDFITIGIIARNEEKNILSTLKSLINLKINNKNYEIILVDGNSTDHTREISDKYLKNQKIKYKIINEKDYGGRGHSFARNLVVKFSSKDSKYIAFTDADCIVDEHWLNFLYEKILNTDSNIAGVGGPRLVKKTSNRKELIINTFLTSFFSSGGNPAFSKRKLKYMSSIAGYNSIYKKEILEKFKYRNEKLTNCDDGEINLRISNKGYKFLYSDDAKIYHSETDSIIQFSKNMKRYGMGIINMMILNKTLARSYMIFPVVGFNIYLILLIPALFIISWISLIPLFFYFLYVFICFLEVLYKTKNIYSLIVFLLSPIQHVSYFIGMFYNLFIKQEFKK